MSSKKSGTRTAVMERNEKPMKREDTEMNTKYAQEVPGKQTQKAQKTQGTQSGEQKQKAQKQKEQPVHTEKVQQLNPAATEEAKGQGHPAEESGEGKRTEAGRQAETAGQSQSDLEKDMYLISETAKLVGVESHVLRYWEEELKLPIRRNELGHRYYTREDVEQFREIKKLKEQGLQLKAIRTVLTDSTLQVMVPVRERTQPVRSMPSGLEAQEDRQLQDKSARLQFLLHNLVAQAVRESNQELTREIKETIMKEMDYQFRIQEEENEKRDRQRTEREEEHYRKLDELIKQYSGRGLTGKERRERKRQEIKERKARKSEEKRKKHSVF